MTYCLSVLFTETKTEKKLKKLPKLRDDPNKIEAAAHKDAEAVPIINDDYSGVVGVVIGSVIGVSLIVALVKRNTHIVQMHGLICIFTSRDLHISTRAEVKRTSSQWNSTTPHSIWLAMVSTGDYRWGLIWKTVIKCQRLWTETHQHLILTSDRPFDDSNISLDKLFVIIMYFSALQTVILDIVF